MCDSRSPSENCQTSIPLLAFEQFARHARGLLPVVEDLGTAFAQVTHAYFPHRHDYYEVFVIRSGHARLTVETNEHCIDKSSVCLLPPGVVHAWHPSVNLSGYILRIPTSLLSSNSVSGTGVDVHPFAPDIRVAFLSDAMRQRIEILASWLNQDSKNGLNLRSEIVRMQVQLLFLEICNATQSLAVYADFDNAIILARFRALVEKNFHRNWSIREYTSRLRVGRARLAHVTRQTLDKTPNQIIQERLMTEATRLVAHTCLQFSQIAEQLGLPSQAYLSRIFRQSTGMSPSLYRAQAQKTRKSA